VAALVFQTAVRVDSNSLSWRFSRAFAITRITITQVSMITNNRTATLRPIW